MKHKYVRLDTRLYQAICKDGHHRQYAYLLKFQQFFSNYVLYNGDCKHLAKLCGVHHKTIKKQIEFMLEVGWAKLTKNGHLRFLSSRELVTDYRRKGKLNVYFYPTIVKMQSTYSINAIIGRLDSTLIYVLVKRANESRKHHGINPFSSKESWNNFTNENKATVATRLFKEIIGCSVGSAYNRMLNMEVHGYISIKRECRHVMADWHNKRRVGLEQIKQIKKHGIKYVLDLEYQYGKNGVFLGCHGFIMQNMPYEVTLNDMPRNKRHKLSPKWLSYIKHDTIAWIVRRRNVNKFYDQREFNPKYRSFALDKEYRFKNDFTV